MNGTLVLLNVELIHKPGWDNVVLDALNQKEKFQVEKLSTKIQALKAIFYGEKNFKWKAKKAYV
jgi:hypothetical protein